MMNQNLAVQLKTDTLRARLEGVKHLANEIKENKLHVPEVEQYALPPRIYRKQPRSLIRLIR